MSRAHRPVLYSFRRCPYAMRARLALAVSQTVCELREVRLAAKPEAMLAVSPKATVPVLITRDGGTGEDRVIDQSIDIMRWALRQNDPENWLARDDQPLVAANDGPFKFHLDRYKYPERHGSDPMAHRGEALRLLEELDQRVAMQGQLCGPARGLADMAIMPFIRQFAQVDREWFDQQPFLGLHGWLAGHLSSELFHTIMIRVPPWAPGDPVTHFPVSPSFQYLAG